MDEQETARQLYQRRAAELGAASADLKAWDGKLSVLRGLTALSFLVVAWAVFNPERLGVAWITLPVVIFVGLVVAHERCARQQRRIRRAQRFYESGLARLDDAWIGDGPTGEEYRQAGHSYADDLDIFGLGSLFQLLCGARTPAGRRRLADWLLRPAAPDLIVERQRSVAELAGQVQLREDISVLGAEVGPQTHPEALARWAGATPTITDPGSIRLWSIVFVAVTLAVAGAAVTGFVSRYWLAAAVVAQSLYAGRHRAAVVPVIEAVAGANRELGLLHELLARLESEPFATPLLRDLLRRLRTGGQQPSVQIGRLRRLVDLLESRRNQIFAPFSALLLWGTHLSAAVEQWRAVNGAAVIEWLDAIAEIEALDSLAGYCFEHPEDPFPSIAKGPATFVGTALGHPLLAAADCVRNDVTLDESQRVLIVSGSNMSGKSTLMRTVGINAVLAQAGAPVRATTLRLSPLQVGGSIRVRDSLRQGMSGFYAEIHRFRAILDLAELTPASAGDVAPPHVLFLLEEILHTTNSHDRRIGAEALLGSLLSRGAIGLVTTHDLAITALADSLGAATNVHFVDELVDGKIRFDYTLRPGVVARSNAVDLMRDIGLDV